MVVDGAGGYCVWERVGASGSEEPQALAVTVLDEPVQPGLALIESLSEGVVLVANPSQALGINGCR